MSSIYKKLNYFNLSLGIFIILWGAWVRLSGSGAGCGDHWPLCNGEVIPLAPNIKTLIEYVHRLTSGIFGVTILAALVIARKLFKPKSWARKFAYASLFFTISEALIGAILVKKGLVVNDQSSLRAWVIGFHLINTFVLLASLVGQITVKDNSVLRFQDFKLNLFWGFGILIFLIVGATGAISALGNTLFPETSLVAGVLKDFQANSHFLIRLRIFHPIFAILLFGIIQYLSFSIELKEAKFLGTWSYVAVMFGAINWFLLAPKWGAIIHLLIADILWCLYIVVMTKAYFFQSNQKTE